MDEMESKPIDNSALGKSDVEPDDTMDTLNTLDTPIGHQSKRRKRESGSQTEPVEGTDLEGKNTVSHVCGGGFKLQDHWEQIMARMEESSLWKQMETGMNGLTEQMEDMEKENSGLRERLRMTEGRATRLERQLGEAQAKMLEMEAHSMRDSVVVKNMAEERGEEITGRLASFFKETLKIKEEIQIEGAHRMGRHTDGGCRNIVAKLTRKTKAKVMTSLKNIPRESSVRIMDQLPTEYTARRTKLWPSFISARKDGRNARLAKDTLIVDNVVVQSPKDRVRDYMMDTAARAMELEPKHTHIITKDKIKLQGHLVHITGVDDVIPAIQALCKDPGVAGSNLMYAYRVGKEDCYTSNYEDDSGEWNGGRTLMQILEERHVMNYLVVVSRWTGGKRISPTKPDAIREVAKGILHKLQ
jgi:hypothetical protein